MATAPILMIAVKDVQSTSKLFSELFDWKSAHGGSEFDILIDEKNTPSLLLHERLAHDHHRFEGVLEKPLGVGQTLYVFLTSIDEVYGKVQSKNLKIIEPLFLNQNSGAREFTFKIDEGHQFSVCEGDCWVYHRGSN